MTTIKYRVLQTTFDYCMLHFMQVRIKLSLGVDVLDLFFWSSHCFHPLMYLSDIKKMTGLFELGY